MTARGGSSLTWHAMFDDDKCDCCTEVPEGSAVAAPGMATPVRGDAPAAGLTAGVDVSQQQGACTLGIAFRQLAWLVHAMLDGMVLASVRTEVLLAPAAFAVFVCALQDSLAFCILLARSRLAGHAVGACLIVFSLAFPVGAGLASAVAQSQSEHGSSVGNETLAVMRVVISAMFVYMACELAPPHSHRRLLNLAHAIVFALGVGVSSLAELFERLTMDD